MTPFAEADARLAQMHGYAPIGTRVCTDWLCWGDCFHEPPCAKPEGPDGA